ncbi:MAG: hypothetical protein HGA80_06390 [Candidatus Omnitrophica bacterium]|nr:hypothetical protein [Candidatus Omnitrophota bacterium]
MMGLSGAFNPPVLKGIKVYPDKPFRFDFILDKGDAEYSDAQLKTDCGRLLKYFLASLTVPEKDLWVNLSPYEQDRIITDSFGQTEMGRDLLAQDYILKQITASVIYPEGEVGKKFWNNVYTEAQKRFGTTDVPIDTFNKVWIVPDKATVYADKGVAFVVDCRLKVMLEADYLAQEKNADARVPNAKTPDTLGAQIVREVVMPILEKEVNEGQHFSQLRQVYNALILATWYKRKVRASILGQAYVDREMTSGIDIPDKAEKEHIWQRYVESFRKGNYNFIREEYDPEKGTSIPRRYFSGGVVFALGERLQVSPSASSAQAVLKPIFRRLWVLSTALMFLMPNYAAGNESAPPAVHGIQQTVAVSSVPEINVEDIQGLRLAEGSEYQIFRLKGSSIYHVELATLKALDEAFARFAVFVDSDKHTQEMLDDRELELYLQSEGLHLASPNEWVAYGLGYNLDLEHLQRFYAEADRNNTKLNALEKRFRADCIALGLLPTSGASLNVKGMTIIATAQDVELYLSRKVVLRHEMHHAMYSTEDWVRQEVRKAWDQLSPDEQKKLASEIGRIGKYNANDTELILTEVFAFVSVNPDWIKVSADPESQLPSPASISFLQNKFKQVYERWQIDHNAKLKGQPVSPSADQAMKTSRGEVKEQTVLPETTGGIDFNDSKVDLITAEEGALDFHLDPDQLKQLQASSGIAPLIIGIDKLSTLSQWGIKD